MIWTKLAASLLALLILAALAVQWRATARERAAEAAYPPEGRILEVQGRDVHAVVKGNGPDLVLIHGSSGNTRDFTHSLVDRLADRYRVIVFDRPGLGYSDRLPQGAEGIHEQAAVLRAAAQALGADKPIVLGHSYGAAVAMAWALDAPDHVAAVVNIAGPSHPWSGPLPRLYQVNSNAVGAALAVPLITAFIGRGRVREAVAEVFAPQSMPTGYAEHFGAPLTLRREPLRANAQHRAVLKREITALAPRYPGFPVPLEIVHGDADTTVSIKIHAERMIQDTDAARLTVIEGGGHMIHHTHADEVVSAIDRAAERAGLAMR
ncbi:MAG: alpha/beta hydrolase [Rhodobacter sp.]|nr:alpha/beta hydrolase [Rhodobacter sp.]